VENARIAANKNIARQFFLHFEKGDVEAVIALSSPAALYWIPTVRREYGMTEFKEALHWIQSRLKGGIRFQLGPITPFSGWKNCLCSRIQRYSSCF
jgi:hypothetical protein